MGLRSYVIRRMIYSLALVVIVIVLDYIIFFAMPGDPYGLFLPSSANVRPEVREQILRFWGYYDPSYVKLAKYIGNLLTWNFGISIRNLGFSFSTNGGEDSLHRISSRWFNDSIGNPWIALGSSCGS